MIPTRLGMGLTVENKTDTIPKSSEEQRVVRGWSVEDT